MDNKSRSVQKSGATPQHRNLQTQLPFLSYEVAIVTGVYILTTQVSRYRFVYGEDGAFQWDYLV